MTSNKAQFWLVTSRDNGSRASTAHHQRAQETDQAIERSDPKWVIDRRMQHDRRQSQHGEGGYALDLNVGGPDAEDQAFRAA